MRIGMSLTSSYPTSGNSESLMANLIEQVELMAELGFYSVSLGDHHVTTQSYFQVLPTISRLSAHTADMKLLPLFLLPFYNPILLAEQIGTLDAISGGRTTVICGLGHQPEAHLAFQTPQRVRVSRFVETLEVLRLLWREDNVDYHGKHYSFNGISINPKPLSQPLQIWFGSGADPAIRRTAQLADAWVISPGWPPDLIKEKLKTYREFLQECRRDEHVANLVLRRDVHLGVDAEAARREAHDLFETGYRGFGPKEIADSLIVGGPGECIRYLENMEQMGITDVLFRCALDEREAALQTIRLLGTEVIPFFR